MPKLMPWYAHSGLNTSLPEEGERLVHKLCLQQHSAWTEVKWCSVSELPAAISEKTNISSQIKNKASSLGNTLFTLNRNSFSWDKRKVRKIVCRNSGEPQ